jgi:DNA polymerase-1
MENGEDIHAYTAKKVEEATKLGCPRQLGKRLNHAANYGMGPEKFADSCLMEADIVLTVNDARKLMEARSRTFPRIAQWQSQIADTLHRTRKLCSPHGRERHFFGQLTDATVREALSFIPQATVVDTLNQGWIAITLDSGYDKDFNMLVQGHDSLLFQVRDECVNYLVALIKQTFSNQGVVINGIWRSIPFDITQGPSWGELNVVI